MKVAFPKEIVMKSLRFASTLISGLFASTLAIGMVASTQTAFAQGDAIVAKAQIPFAFQAGSTVMPAGTYTVTSESDHLLLLRETTNNTSDFVLVHGAYTNHTPTKSVISFDRRGDKYFLRQIWIAGNNSGMECPKARAEKQLEVAKTSVPSDTITLALNTTPQR